MAELVRLVRTPYPLPLGALRSRRSLLSLESGRRPTPLGVLLESMHAARVKGERAEAQVNRQIFCGRGQLR